MAFVNNLDGHSFNQRQVIHKLCLVAKVNHAYFHIEQSPCIRNLGKTPTQFIVFVFMKDEWRCIFVQDKVKLNFDLTYAYMRMCLKFGAGAAQIWLRKYSVTLQTKLSTNRPLIHDTLNERSTKLSKLITYFKCTVSKCLRSTLFIRKQRWDDEVGHTEGSEPG